MCSSDLWKFVPFHPLHPFCPPLPLTSGNHQSVPFLFSFIIIIFLIIFIGLFCFLALFFSWHTALVYAMVLKMSIEDAMAYRSKYPFNFTTCCHTANYRHCRDNNLSSGFQFSVSFIITS